MHLLRFSILSQKIMLGEFSDRSVTDLRAGHQGGAVDPQPHLEQLLGGSLWRCARHKKVWPLPGLGRGKQPSAHGQPGVV